VQIKTRLTRYDYTKALECAFLRFVLLLKQGTISASGVKNI
jgi:hypothetical protein